MAANALVISGFYGVPNAGDEAVCRATLRGLARVLPGTAAFVLTRDAGVSTTFTHPQATLLEGAFPTPRFWKGLPDVIRAVRHARLVAIGGGGLWQDVHSWTMPLAHLYPACLALLLGVPACTVGLGVGPLKNPRIRKAIGLIAPHFAALWVRDQDSARELIACGVPASRVLVGADVATSLFADGPPVLPAESRSSERVAIALRRWKGLDLDRVARLLDRLVADGNAPILLGFEPPFDDDCYRDILARCAPETRLRCRVPEVPTLDSLVAEIAASRVLISMRLHGCILAAMQGVPFLPVSYDPKVAAFAGQAGMAPHVVSVDAVGPDLADRLPAVERDRDAMIHHCAAIARVSARMFTGIAAAATTPPALRARVLGGLVLLPVLGLGAAATAWGALRSAVAD